MVGFSWNSGPVSFKKNGPCIASSNVAPHGQGLLKDSLMVGINMLLW